MTEATQKICKIRSFLETHDTSISNEEFINFINSLEPFNQEEARYVSLVWTGYLRLKEDSASENSLISLMSIIKTRLKQEECESTNTTIQTMDISQSDVNIYDYVLIKNMRSDEYIVLNEKELRKTQNDFYRFKEMVEARDIDAMIYFYSLLSYKNKNKKLKMNYKILKVLWIREFHSMILSLGKNTQDIVYKLLYYGGDKENFESLEVFIKELKEDIKSKKYEWIESVYMNFPFWFYLDLFPKKVSDLLKKTERKFEKYIAIYNSRIEKQESEWQKKLEESSTIKYLGRQNFFIKSVPMGGKIR